MMETESAITRARARSHPWWIALVVLTALCCVAAIEVIFLKAPLERRMGVVQKIFYFHVPAAYGMYLGALACFVGSAGYLARAAPRWDAIARGGAELAVVMGLIVLTTGPLWASQSWGRYWAWDPRLTTALLSFLIYVAYLTLRGFVRGGDAARRFAAALGVLGAANVPIIHLSVQKWGGQHPQVITGSGGGLHHADMKLALALGFVTFTLLGITLIGYRVRIHLASWRLEALEHEAAARGMIED